MINRENRTPLYSQLVKELLKLIESELNPNDKLPSEKEICEMYAVSRTTVRLAMDELEKCGYIYRLQGKGSFVTNFHSNVNNSFEVIDDRKILENEYAESYSCVDGLFGITSILPNNMQELFSSMKFQCVQFIISTEGTETMVVNYYLNLNLFGHMDYEELMNNYVDNICEKHNVVIKEITETYQIVHAYQEMSEKLHVEENTPILRIDKTYYDTTNELAIFSMKHINSNKYKYRNFLKREF